MHSARGCLELFRPEILFHLRVPSSFSFSSSLRCIATPMFHSGERFSTFVPCSFVLSRFWYPRLLFSRSAALPPPPCTLHFDSFVEDQGKWYLQAFVFVSLWIIVHVSLSDTLVSLLAFALSRGWNLVFYSVFRLLTSLIPSFLS